MSEITKNAYFTIVNKDNIGLAADFSVNPNSCQNSDFYSYYIRYTALSDYQAGKSTTHLFVDEDTNKVMGFVSLRSSSVISKDEHDNTTGSPALEVMVLAVDKIYERRKVGSTLIDYVISQADELHQKFIGVRYITLAADPLSVPFYEKMGFTSLDKRWYNIPKESWSADCIPMSLFLDFESKNVAPYPDVEE